MKSERSGILRLFSLILLTAVFCSCQQSKLSGRLNTSDSVSIDFTDENQMVIKQVETTNMIAIKRLSEYIGNKKFEKNQCYLGGRMIFFQSGMPVEQVEFNTSSNCRYFTFISEGELVSTKMSEEAASFLESIRDGKDYY